MARTATTTTKKREKKQESATGLILIAIFKLIKALALIAVGVGALKYLHKDLAASVLHWVEVLRVDPDNRFIHPLLAKAFSVTPKQLKELSAGTFFYAALLGIEGIGLLMRKHWAEYGKAYVHRVAPEHVGGLSAGGSREPAETGSPKPASISSLEGLRFFQRRPWTDPYRKGPSLFRPGPHLKSWPNYFLCLAFLARAADP